MACTPEHDDSAIAIERAFRRNWEEFVANAPAAIRAKLEDMSDAPALFKAGFYRGALYGSVAAHLGPEAALQQIAQARQEMGR